MLKCSETLQMIHSCDRRHATLGSAWALVCILNCVAVRLYKLIPYDCVSLWLESCFCILFCLFCFMIIGVKVYLALIHFILSFSSQILKHPPPYSFSYYPDYVVSLIFPLVFSVSYVIRYIWQLGMFWFWKSMGNICFSALPSTHSLPHISHISFHSSVLLPQ